ncbi:MAG: hypothetical protein EOO51_08450 [Flavobacterium sp.]|nr:MAG: hypothetical protein EOO51_08450 [Flavobacterium sp.]
MQQFRIKTHKPGTTYSSHHFFILNRGYNCGKPLQTECPNCFVLEFDSQTSAENHYWLAYNLWSSKYWHQFLIGSVIPFFRIDSFKQEFERKSKKILFEFDQHQKQVNALRMLQQQEEKCHKTLKVIKDMRQVTLAWYYN